MPSSKPATENLLEEAIKTVNTDQKITAGDLKQTDASINKLNVLVNYPNQDENMVRAGELSSKENSFNDYEQSPDGSARRA